MCGFSVRPLEVSDDEWFIGELCDSAPPDDPHPKPNKAPLLNTTHRITCIHTYTCATSPILIDSMSTLAKISKDYSICGKSHSYI